MSTCALYNTHETRLTRSYHVQLCIQLWVTGTR